MTAAALIELLATVHRDAEVFMEVDRDGVLHEKRVDGIQRIPKIVLMAEHDPPPSRLVKIKPRVAENVEVNHQSIVIHVHRHGGAGAWFTTVSKDCIQVYRSDDRPQKEQALLLALTWLKDDLT